MIFSFLFILISCDSFEIKSIKYRLHWNISSWYLAFEANSLFCSVAEEVLNWLMNFQINEAKLKNCIAFWLNTSSTFSYDDFKFRRSERRALNEELRIPNCKNRKSCFLNRGAITGKIWLGFLNSPLHSPQSSNDHFLHLFNFYGRSILRRISQRMGLLSHRNKHYR